VSKLSIIFGEILSRAHGNFEQHNGVLLCDMFEVSLVVALALLQQCNNTTPAQQLGGASLLYSFGNAGGGCSGRAASRREQCDILGFLGNATMKTIMSP
jgi:hypothetical protein